MLLNIGNLGFRYKARKIFTPTNISNITLWLDASDTSTITHISGAVSQWNDKSGNNNHATQTTTANQPITNSVTIGGKNAIAFDGTSDFMNITAAVSRTNGYSVFVVNSPDSVSANPRTYIGGPSGAFTFRIDDTPLQTQIVKASVAVILGGNDTPAANTSYISSCRSSIMGNNIQINGSTVGSDNINPAYSSDCDIIGTNSSTFGFFDGKIGEIIIYAGILTDVEMNQVGNYLSAKWGISWSNI